MNEKHLNILLNEAKKALKTNNVPIGCIIVKNNKIIGKAHNKKESSNVATDHAEILAIKQACKKLHTWRLNDCVLYVTLKPCEMCIGAIKESRIDKVIYLLDTNYEQLKDKKIEFIKEESDEYKILIKTFFKNMR